MAKEIRDANLKPQDKKTLADKFVAVIGSWKFIVGQSAAMVLWVILNTTTPVRIDPFPYILLNLLLSTQAALVGPIILMSSNRQGDLDRRRDVDHYLLDVAESETVRKMAEHLEEIRNNLRKRG